MLETIKTSDIVDHFYTPGIGAAAYAAKKVDHILKNEVADPPSWVTGRVDALRVQLEEARGLRYDYDNRKSSEPLRRKGAAQADNQVDRAVSTLYENAKSYQELDESTEEYKLSAELIEGCFPDGVYPITSGRYEEQHSKVNELLGRLRGPFAVHVDKLSLGLFVANVDGHNVDYGQKLSSRNKTGVTFDQVQNAEHAAVESYFEVILSIWVAFLDDLATRTKVLAPIEEQNQRIARYFKRRGRAPIVDPNTGDVVDPDEPVDEDVEPVDEDVEPVVDPVVEPDVEPGE